MNELFKLTAKSLVRLITKNNGLTSINFNLIFNKRVIREITITDHPWKKPGRENISKKLILEMLIHKLNGEILTPESKKNPNWKRDRYVLKRIPFGDKNYKLVFWFKDGTNNHLWVKNCHEQD